MNHIRLLHPSILYRSILRARNNAITTETYSRPGHSRPRLTARRGRFVDKHCTTTTEQHPANVGLRLRVKESLSSSMNVYSQSNGKLCVEPIFVCENGHILVVNQQLKKKSSSRRSESLNKDVRITSLMCLTDGMHIYPAHMLNDQSRTTENKKEIKEYPAVFMIEESQLNSLLSVISSSILELQIKEKLLKLVNELFHVDKLICLTAKPHKSNLDDITCTGRTNNIDRWETNIHNSNYHSVTEDRVLINDIIKDEWHEHDIKYHSYCNNLLDHARLRSVPSTDHVYFRRGVPQLSSQKVDAPNDKHPSKEQLHLMMETLTEEMPSFFEKHHDFNIYSPDILFENKILHIKTRGIVAYKGSIQFMKYSSFVYFVDVQMEVLKITLQEEHDNIQVRWRVKGLPVHFYYINKILRRKSKYRYVDAFSTFYVGQNGLIHRHVLDKVMPSPEEKVQSGSWIQRLALSLGLVRSPSLAGDWNGGTR